MVAHLYRLPNVYCCHETLPGRVDVISDNAGVGSLPTPIALLDDDTIETSTGSGR